MKFKNCQKPVIVNDYNINIRRYIESESMSPGSGLKLVVGCAFTMNLSSDPSIISINELTLWLTCKLVAKEFEQEMKWLK